MFFSKKKIREEVSEGLCHCGCNEIVKTTLYIYKREDTGEEFSGKLPPGSMYYLDAYFGDKWGSGPDGKFLSVVCPNGLHWVIDSRAGNCTMPEDFTHRCWVRHGEPPNITVDKNGLTCSAGAGSIQAGNYHGFLRNGEFVDA